jgi:hypothetical protein
MKRLITFLLVFTFIFAFSACKGSTNETTTTAATTPQRTYATGDIITYGSYPQTKVTSASLISALNAQTLQTNNIVNYEGSKYKRVYFTNATNPNKAINGYYKNTVYWFKFEPIKWRILSNTNGELFVMAVKILESRVYQSSAYTNVTWKICTLRNWLNNDFYNTAFNSSERAKIETSTVVNTGANGENNTNDKLFLLSYEDTVNTAYGFSSDSGADSARQAQGTDYAKSNGLYVYTYVNSIPVYSNWWLRSTRSNSSIALNVDDIGIVSDDDNEASLEMIGVRPAFNINQSSAIFSSSIT